MWISVTGGQTKLYEFWFKITFSAKFSNIIYSECQDSSVSANRISTSSQIFNAFKLRKKTFKTFEIFRWFLSGDRSSRQYYDYFCWIFFIDAINSHFLISIIKHYDSYAAHDIRYHLNIDKNQVIKIGVLKNINIYMLKLRVVPKINSKLWLLAAENFTKNWPSHWVGVPFLCLPILCYLHTCITCTRYGLSQIKTLCLYSDLGQIQTVI